MDASDLARGRCAARGRRMNARPADRRQARRRAATASPPGEVLMDVRNVSLSFGGVRAITDISFDVRKGEIRAIIGPNGAGKTSMLNVINGFYTPQQGRSASTARSASDEAASRGRVRASPAPSRTSRCSRACRRSTTS